MTKLPALTPDDPLRLAAAPPAATPAAPKPTPPESPAISRRRSTRRAAVSPDRVIQEASSENQWTGVTDVTTFRLPVEVLNALHERSKELGIAKGMTVAVALTELLQRTDTELVQLVEETQQRYDTARRRARRAA
jgi:hypothetical protein